MERRRDKRNTERTEKMKKENTLQALLHITLRYATAY